MSEPVFQSSLGTVNDSSTRAGKTWNDGSLDTGQVTRMHHKRSTADSEILNGPNEIASSDENEGMNAPVLCSRYAGYDTVYQRPYGEFLPLQKGDRPVIVYAKNQKSKPLIVGVMHHTDENAGEINDHDILPTEYPIDPSNMREALRQVWIHRSQDGFTIDGANGEFEISSHTKSFLVSGGVHLDEETFDYEDLTLKDKKSIEAGDPKTIYLPEKYSKPLKYFAVFRNKYEDADTDYLRFCVDASKVAFKWLQQKPNEDKLTYAELEEDGAVKVRRQLDSKITGEGERYTQACIDEDGNATVQHRASEDDQTNYVCVHENTILLRRQLDSREMGEGEKYTYISIDESGDLEAVNHIGDTPAILKMQDGKISLSVGASSITMYPDHIDINSPLVNIN